MSNNKAKVTIELTEKQLDYLSTALFEFSTMFPNASSEYLYKACEKKLNKAEREIKSIKEFYLLGAAYKAEMKLINSRKKC